MDRRRFPKTETDDARTQPTHQCYYLRGVEYPGYWTEFCVVCGRPRVNLKPDPDASHDFTFSVTYTYPPQE